MRNSNAAMALLACAALSGGPAVTNMPDAPGIPTSGPSLEAWGGRRRPPWESGGHSHGNGKLRKGTKPKVKQWRIVPPPE